MVDNDNAVDCDLESIVLDITPMQAQSMMCCQYIEVIQKSNSMLKHQIVCSFKLRWHFHFNQQVS